MHAIKCLCQCRRLRLGRSRLRFLRPGAARPLILTLWLVSACPAGPAAGPRLWNGGGKQDIWRPGCALRDWERIEAIQKHGLYPARSEPNWGELVKDEHPLVRAAACLAMGRSAEPKRAK